MSRLLGRLYFFVAWDMMRFVFAEPVASRAKPDARSPQEDDMAKGQQRSNKEKKKPKQDKKKLAPAPSPLASDQHGKPGWGGKKK
jgi:hypothetical protein